jgi:hypothetical protein
MDKLFGIRLEYGKHGSWLHNVNQDWKTGIFFGRQGSVVYPTQEAALVDYAKIKAESDKEIKARSEYEVERRAVGELPNWIDSISVEELEPCGWEVYFFVEKSSPAGKTLTNDYERGKFVQARSYEEAMVMAKALPRDSRFNAVLLQCAEEVEALVEP